MRGKLLKMLGIEVTADLWKQLFSGEDKWYVTENLANVTMLNNNCVVIGQPDRWPRLSSKASTNNYYTSCPNKYMVGTRYIHCTVNTKSG